MKPYVGPFCGMVLLNLKFAPVAWHKVCLPHKFGWVGVRNFAVWNQAAVLKQLWAIDQAKDRLWLKWIYAYYKSVFDMKIPTVTTWLVKKVLGLRGFVGIPTAIKVDIQLLKLMQYWWIIKPRRCTGCG